MKIKTPQPWKQNSQINPSRTHLFCPSHLNSRNFLTNRTAFREIFLLLFHFSYSLSIRQKYSTAKHVSLEPLNNLGKGIWQRE